MERSDSRRWTFDADPHAFKLASEASRISMAGLSDPMLAIETAKIDPLPHQIKAVYGEMLPKPGPLRFLLADDPGAGKTVMAGLYLKELVLRGDVQRALIVAPGGLVDQWQAELADKFDLRFEVLGRSRPQEVSASQAHSADNPFVHHSFLIARMDQLARNEEWLTHLRAAPQWDAIVVDEAHRMSAHYWGGELKRTRRYQLGQALRDVTRHFLLMTATPRAGKEEDFHLFLALLDPDRFEGQYRKGVHSRDTAGIMRRMVKEELLTFDGKPLFPQRVAQTVTDDLSDAEMALYNEVTEYVATEMNRADGLAADGQNSRRRTVGFALTVLQRRLASSPEAIYRSLRRRRARLEVKRDEMLGIGSIAERAVADRLAVGLPDAFDEDEFSAAELETIEEEILDSATAARIAEELSIEIAVLADLERSAAAVRASGLDRKWVELRSLITRARLDDQGRELAIPRKLIVFTEHRDTLEYLAERISSSIGDPEAVVTIHGGTSRARRQEIRATFAHDPRCQVLLATDAAGEGLNLQVAHLMVNYDLPWNPNRLEQRFGRIHRIGQTEVCRLWNLVAAGTREGQVFGRLLEKIEAQRQAYSGKVFDVLGEQAFAQRPLRELLIDAIRYGDRPEVRGRLDQVIDASVANGMQEVLRERALATGDVTRAALARLRAQMDEARARRLQPHYIELFALEALRSFGVRAASREAGTWELRHVPTEVRGTGRPIPPRYARITFDPAIARESERGVELVAPGHPLMDRLVAAVLERDSIALSRGAVFVDPEDRGDGPARLLLVLREEIADGNDNVVNRRLSFVSLSPDGGAAEWGIAPYLDLAPVPPAAVGLVEATLADPWWGDDVAAVAAGWSASHGLPAHLAEVAARVSAVVDTTRTLVRQRLGAQANYWYGESERLAETERLAADGKSGRKARLTSGVALARAREMDGRLEARMAQLDRAAELTAGPPVVVSAALVLPAGAVERWVGECGVGERGDAEQASEGAAPEDSEFAVATYRARDVTDRRAVDAVLRAEVALGRRPQEMVHNNKGYDILSTRPDGSTLRIEVKGRIVGAETFMVSSSEVLLGKNAGRDHRLVLVEVDHDAPAGSEPLRYIADAFAHTSVDAYETLSVQFQWPRMWGRGSAPF